MIQNDHSDPRVFFQQMHLGGDRNFCYLMADRQSGEAAVVDPAFRPDRVMEQVRTLGLTLRYILITHGHSDHVGQSRELAAETGATICCGPGIQIENAHVLEDGISLPLGDRSIRCLQTPGHCPGHFCFLFEDRLCTGDLLFCGKVGGTGQYFPGSSAEQEWESLQKVLRLPDETLVFPGHNYYGGEGEMPHSTIGFERENNPFLAGDFAAFVDLKENWAKYKEKYGIR